MSTKISRLTSFKLPACATVLGTKLRKKTIANCFCKGGFCHIEGEEENKAAREVVPTADNWEDVGHDAGIRYEEFVNMDEDLAVCGEQTDAEIVADRCV